MRRGYDLSAGPAHREIENGDVRQVPAERRPGRTMVARAEHPEIRAHVDRSAERGRDQHGVHGHVRQIAADVLPGQPAVRRAEDVAGAETGDGDDRGQRVGGIDADVRDVAVRQPGRARGPVRTAIGRHVERAVARAGVHRRGRGGRGRDGRDAAAAGAAQIAADRRPAVAAVRRSVDTVRAEVEHLRIGGIHHERRNEQRVVVHIDADDAADERATGQIAAARAREARSRGPLRLGVGRHRIREIDRREPAVRAQHGLPFRYAAVLERAVVLSAAQHDARIGRMERDARVELRDLEVAVDARPVDAAVARAVDAAVVAGVHDGGVDRIERDRVVVDVDSVQHVGEQAAAVE